MMRQKQGEDWRNQQVSSSLNSHAPVAGLPASLAQSHLFDGILAPDRERIAGVAECRKVVDDVIIRGGERAAYLFLLNSGQAKYYKVTKSGQELVLWWLSAGDVFGLATLLRDPPAYIGSVQPIKPCELLVWKHSTIQELLTRYPQLSQNALRITLRYLSGYVDRHAAIITRTAEQRLAHTLIRLANQSGHPHSTDVEVEITNEQLGQLADVGLFTATRFLSAWQRNGAITKKRGKVLVQAPEKLPVD
jgi:CRP/FNR family transcriptional regulator, nitrogen oxide reductase regulator